MDIESNRMLNVNQKSRGSKSVNEEKKPMKSEFSNPLFVNHAELAWHEIRRAWIGDRSQTSHSKFRQPILSWTTSFEDFLASGEPFPEPIHLADVVDLLVDIWDEEGCYRKSRSGPLIVTLKGKDQETVKAAIESLSKKLSCGVNQVSV